MNDILLVLLGAGAAIPLTLWRIFGQEKSHQRLAKDYASALANKGREVRYLSAKVLMLERELRKVKQPRDARGRFVSRKAF